MTGIKEHKVIGFVDGANFSSVASICTQYYYEGPGFCEEVGQNGSVGNSPNLKNRPRPGSRLGKVDSSRLEPLKSDQVGFRCRHRQIQQAQLQLVFMPSRIENTKN